VRGSIPALLQSVVYRLEYPVCGIVLAAALAACVTVPDYEVPTVSVTAFDRVPAGTMTPRFRMSLHIINPNRVPLELNGIVYSVYIEDHKILTGTSNELPVIEARGEREVSLHAVTEMVGGISLLSELINNPRSEYRYRIDATLDSAGEIPDTRVVNEGIINLNR